MTDPYASTLARKRGRLRTLENREYLARMAGEHVKPVLAAMWAVWRKRRPLSRSRTTPSAGESNGERNDLPRTVQALLPDTAGGGIMTHTKTIPRTRDNALQWANAKSREESRPWVAWCCLGDWRTGRVSLETIATATLETQGRGDLIVVQGAVRRTIAAKNAFRLVDEYFPGSRHDRRKNGGSGIDGVGPMVNNPSSRVDPASMCAENFFTNIPQACGCSEGPNSTPAIYLLEAPQDCGFFLDKDRPYRHASGHTDQPHTRHQWTAQRAGGMTGGASRHTLMQVATLQVARFPKTGPCCGVARPNPTSRRRKMGSSCERSRQIAT